MFVGIQNLTIALSVILVISTGALIGVLTITTGNDLLNKARRQGDEGLATCLLSGENDIRMVAARYLKSVVGEVDGKIKNFLDVPTNALLETAEFLKVQDPDLVTSPTFVDKVMRTFMRTRLNVMAPHGTDQIGYFPLFFSPSHPPPPPPAQSTWGPSIAFVHADETFGVLPEDTKHVVVMEQRLADRTYGRNLTHSVFGDADAAGGMIAADQPCNPLPNFAAGEHLGYCPVLSEFFGSPFYEEIHRRATYNAFTADGVLNPADQVIFAPIAPQYSFLGIYATITFTHPAMLNLSPRQQGRVGSILVSLQATGLSNIFTQAVLPTGSHLYCIERNPWTTEVGTLMAYNKGRVFDQHSVLLPGSTTPHLTSTLIHVTNHTLSQNSTTLSTMGEHGRHVFAEYPTNYSGAMSDMGDNFKEWVDSEGTTFWTMVGEHRRGELVFFTTLLVPRGAVMDQIDISTNTIRLNNELQREDSDDQQRKSQLMMSCVTGGVVFMLLILAVVFTRIIISPLISLGHDMANVAIMDLEAIDLHAPHSRLSEVAAMQVSFSKMVNNLREYRNYMPQSVLVKEDETEEEETELTEGYNGSSHLEAASQKSSSHVQSDLNSSHKKGSGMGARGVLVNDGLKGKVISVVYCNIQDWHKRIARLHDGEVVALHASVIGAIMQSVQETKGICDSFSGDRIFGVYNAFLPLRTHRSNCSLAALRAVDRVKKLLDEPLVLSFACASGEAKVGNMGCMGMKKVTITSTTMPWVVALERYNRTKGFAGMVDHFLAKDVMQEYVMQCTDGVVYSKRYQKSPIKVYQLLKKHESQHEEWMYQLENAAKAPHQKWNKVFDAAIRGDYDTADQDVKELVSASDEVCRRKKKLIFWGKLSS